jgi:RNA methyltransferase, TrmH family
MISKNQIKWITSLHLKKYRKEEQLFIAEGVKVIQEFLQSNFELEHLFVTSTIFEAIDSNKISLITEDEMQKISTLSTSSSCLAVFKMRNTQPQIIKGLIVALDTVRDPGNLGTIIRLCDWFGIESIYCSHETVDVYNPKVIQATMGSLARVNIHYVDLAKWLSKIKLPIYGTFMEGDNIYSLALPEEAVLVFGNESNGISKDCSPYVIHKITIPRFGNIQATESLNVATATAICLSEFKRNFNER